MINQGLRLLNARVYGFATSPVSHSAGQMSKDASTFFKHVKTDGVLVGAIVLGVSVIGYSQYSVST